MLRHLKQGRYSGRILMLGISQTAGLLGARESVRAITARQKETDVIKNLATYKVGGTR